MLALWSLCYLPIRLAHLVHFLPLPDETVHTKNDFHVVYAHIYQVYQRQWLVKVFHAFIQSTLASAFEQGPKAGEIIKRRRHSHCTGDTWSLTEVTITYMNN